jgi:hypothetical protein
LKTARRVTSLEIQGPDEVDENSVTPLTCIAHCNFGPDMDFTSQKVKWSSTAKAAKVKKGLLTVKEVTDDTPCTLTATYGKKDSVAQGTLDITIRNTGP